MTRRMCVLLIFLTSLAAQPLPAVEEGAIDGAGQESADADTTKSGNKTARPEDEEPECD